MHARSTILIALLTAAAASPASAQSSYNPNTFNSANERMANQSQIRSIEQQQQFRNNQTQIQIQRNELFQPTPTGPIIAPRAR